MRINLEATEAYSQLPDADWSLIPHHMHEGIARWVVLGVLPGDFLHNLIANDFKMASRAADEHNLRGLGKWAMFLHNHVPTDCWGSPEAVARWHSHGGFYGLCREAKEAADRAEREEGAV